MRSSSLRSSNEIKSLERATCHLPFTPPSPVAGQRAGGKCRASDGEQGLWVRRAASRGGFITAHPGPEANQRTSRGFCVSQVHERQALPTLGGRGAEPQAYLWAPGLGSRRGPHQGQLQAATRHTARSVVIAPDEMYKPATGQGPGAICHARRGSSEATGEGLSTAAGSPASADAGEAGRLSGTPAATDTQMIKWWPEGVPGEAGGENIVLPG